MKKIRLGLNIDHVATVRNARGEIYPDPIRAALLAEKSGVDSITIHLREDRRHIKDRDLFNLKKKLKIPLNLEMAPTKRMLDIAVKHKPNFVCIVPEKRQEITTEGGLNLNKRENFLRKIIFVDIPQLRHNFRRQKLPETSISPYSSTEVSMGCPEHPGIPPNSS